MTHREACDALLANTALYTAGRITRQEWDQEVERILEARFPNATDPQRALSGALIGPPPANHTSTTPDTQRREVSPPPAVRRARADGTGAQ